MNFIVILLYLTSSIKANILLDGNFQECLISSKENHLVFDKNCFNNENNFQRNDLFERGLENLETGIFFHSNYVLETIGYECSITIYKYTFTRDFFGSLYTNKDVKILTLTVHDCRKMIQLQKCGQEGILMNCLSNDTCSFKENIIYEFPLNSGTIIKLFYECSFQKRFISSQSLIDPIPIRDTIQPCYASDGICFLQKSIIIWNIKDIKSCPFDLIDIKKLTMKKNNIFISNDKYLFAVKNLSYPISRTDCEDLSFYETFQGFFLVFSNNKIKKFIKKNISKHIPEHFYDKNIQDLIFAENDYKKYKLFHILQNVLCSLIQNTIQSNLNDDDKFIKVNNND
jgi:hypothetical protein